MIKNKRGASIIWVLCLMVVVLIIGGSILSASVMASGAATRYRSAKHCAQYTRALASVLTDDICSVPIAINGPWGTIAQSVYAAGGKEVALDDVALALNFPTAGQNGTPVTTLDISLTNQVRDTTPYELAPYDDGEGEGEDDDTTPEQTELADISFGMTIRLETQYAGQTHVIYVKYTFGGTITRDDNGVEAFDNESAYKYMGVFDTP